jgi:hypothetical protein
MLMVMFASLPPSTMRMRKKYREKNDATNTAEKRLRMREIKTTWREI